MDLAKRTCVPCEGGTGKLDDAQASALLPAIPGWTSVGGRLERSFTFRDFVAAMRFLDVVAEVAEQEGHHPDFCVHYSRVDFRLWTHAVGGLSENDFILAAKIDVAARDAGAR